MIRLVRKQLLLLFTVILATAFFSLAYIVSKDIFHDFDYKNLLYLQSVISRRVDTIFSFFDIIGSTEVSLAILFILFLLILLFKRQIFLGIFLFFSIYIVELWGKLFIFHPKPPVIFNRYDLGWQLPSSYFVHTDFSFPSGHVARTVFLVAVTLYLLYQLRISRYKKVIFTGFLLTYAMLVALSRIYLGEHWFSDVFGGILLGANAAFLSFLFW